jgi:peroxiredoxin
MNNKKIFTVMILLAISLTAWLATQSKTTPVGLRAISKKAPDFTLMDLEGKAHSLSEYRGKVILVNFWATWCPPCRDEMPSMQRLWTQLKDDGFTILAIDIGETADDITPFTMEYDLDFPILLDPESKTATKWSVRGLPTSFLVDKQGTMVYQTIGGREWDDAQSVEIIKKILAEDYP